MRKVKHKLEAQFQCRFLQENPVADQQRLQISELHFEKLLTPSTFSRWMIRFKTEVCTCSQFLTEAKLWIKEVEMAHSVDDQKSSRSIQGYTHFPNLEMLDARLASALNKIIQNSYFKKKVSLEEQKAQTEDRFLRGRQIAHMIYDYFRVTGALMIQFLIMPPYSLSLFATMMFRNLIRYGMKFYDL